MLENLRKTCVSIFEELSVILANSRYSLEHPSFKHHPVMLKFHEDCDFEKEFEKLRKLKFTDIIILHRNKINIEKEVLIGQP